jgi:hypothetical protein
MWEEVMGWGLPSEIERRKRIRLAVAAYAEKMWGEALVKSAKIENLKR